MNQKKTENKFIKFLKRLHAHSYELYTTTMSDEITGKVESSQQILICSFCKKQKKYHED